MSGAPVLPSGTPVFAAAAQGMSLDHQVLKVKESCTPGSKGTVTIRKIDLDRLPPPGYCTDS